MTVLQLLGQAGCGLVDLVVDDEIPDPEGLAPSAEGDGPLHSDPTAPIVTEVVEIELQISDGGSTASKDGSPLAGDGAVDRFLRRVVKNLPDSTRALLVLRVPPTVRFKYVRSVIRIGAANGISEVSFISENRRQVLVEQGTREPDLRLPSADPEEVPVAVRPIFIKIDGLQRIYVNTGRAQELLDSNSQGVSSHCLIDGSRPIRRQPGSAMVCPQFSSTSIRKPHKEDFWTSSMSSGNMRSAR